MFVKNPSQRRRARSPRRLGALALGSILSISAFGVGTAPTVSAQQLTFTQDGDIAIPNRGRLNLTIGVANPLPSKLSVSAMTGKVSKVTVALNGLQHGESDNIDMMLVGPTGARAILMSDVGGNNSLSANLVLDDAAAAQLPNSAIASGTYRPRNIGAEVGDLLGAGDQLSAFNGTAPNGEWKLYAWDDEIGSVGTLDSWSLTITTVTEPSISGPADITTGTDIDQCVATIALPSAVTQGDPDPTVTVTPTWPTKHAVGTVAYTLTAANGVSPDAQATFNVTVNDNQPPLIALGGGLTSPLRVDASSASGALVSYPAVVAIDNCQGVSVVRSAGPASGQLFAPGPTTVTHTATDTSGNSSSVSFTVVVDTAAPTIATVANIVRSTDPDACYATISAPTPVVTGTPSPTSTFDPAWPGDGRHGVGVHGFSVRAANGILPNATTSFTVTVNDSQVPVLSATADITVPAQNPFGATVTYETPTATDNCPGQTVLHTAGPASGSLFPPGTSTVSHTSTDASGNSTTKSFTVTVIPATALLDQLIEATPGAIEMLRPRTRIENLLDQIQREINAGDTRGACNTLTYFQHLDNPRLYYGITAEEIAAYYAHARTISNALGCEPWPETEK